MFILHAQKSFHYFLKTLTSVGFFCCFGFSWLLFFFFGRAVERCCWRDIPFFSWWSSKPACAVSQWWNNCSLDKTFSAEHEKISNGNRANLSLLLEKEGSCGPVAIVSARTDLQMKGLQLLHELIAAPRVHPIIFSVFLPALLLRGMARCQQYDSKRWALPADPFWA